MRFKNNMENNVSFTGINNLFIGKNISQKFGTYITSSGVPKLGNKNYTIMKIKCNLTDDAAGKDLTEFREALERCKCFQADAVLDTDIGTLNFITKRCDVKDNCEHVSNSNFFINGVQVAANERKILPLFTYLAALTRKLKTHPVMNDAKDVYVNLTNESIHEEAMKFIDNMY